MAKRKGKGPQEQSLVTDTVIEREGDETHIHRTVREWHQHAPERLMEIEAIIDSWGRQSAGSYAAPVRAIDYSELEERVDKLTKRVKASRKVVVQETVTDWVERPVAETESEPEPATATEIAVEETVAVHEEVTRPARPRRHFLGFFGKKSPRAAKPKKAKAKKGKPADTSDPDYQPQCAALTEDGSQCRNSARGVSRYCSSHKGYQPPTAKGLAQRIEGEAWDPRDDVTDHQSVRGADTRPVVRKAKDTRIKVRKAPKKKSGRKKR
ncbi:MAG: hypothetical protein QOC71_1423 [Thermoplasmata archaeon]|jgi:predicted transcriptional regulator|nr:hypothetical protein [Thermoplasmata archaeon]